jgi:uncharacterized protein (DUF58 family)
MHRSPYHGFSVEFAEYREYAPGDDIKHIDWRVWGRADRFLVKQYEEETNLTCHIMLDCSKSMAYGEDAEGLSKFDYAATLTACLSLLIQRQQDAVGAVFFDSAIRQVVPPSAHPRQAQTIVHGIESCQPDNRSDVDEVFLQLVGQLRRRGLVVLVSDFLMNLDHLERLLQQLGHARHEVVLIQVLHEHEVTFPFDGNTQFHGLEADQQLLVDAPALRRAYLEAMEAFRATIRRLCGRCRTDYVFAHTGMNLDVVLSEYLASRQANRRAR